MLSYRHAYHAGNFADVMKHLVLTSLLRYLTRKDAAMCYIDTHAGAGVYDLQSDHARKTGENTRGIGRLWGPDPAPAAVADYLALVRRFNPGSQLRRYPGSPWFAAQLLRPGDRLVLCEMHSTDFPSLRKTFRRDPRVEFHAGDGYRTGVERVPPRERRGLVLMDPSYEVAGEYDTAVATIAKMYRKFTTGTYALWYPILDEGRAPMLQRKLQKSPIRDVLHLALRVADGAAQPGMYGSGMIIINPPWTLRADMEPALAFLSSKLAAGPGAGFTVEQWVDE